MNSILERQQIRTRISLSVSPSQQPYFLSTGNPPPPPQPSTFSLNNNVSPSILLIIVILAIIFFISGLLHLLVRYLLRPPNRDPDELDNVTALQGQLQQLFHLHDAGVDQSFIDTLPVFNYREVIGIKDPFDCAVCLCEFEGEDKLRLLPKCSHAFHMDCIDTWLLSHSTCPLCRANLVSEFSSNGNGFSPIVLVLESGSESVRENASERELVRVSSHLSGACGGDSFRVGGNVVVDPVQKSGEIDDDNREKVVVVKLGKFTSVDDGGGSGSEGTSGGESESNAADARRCFSMGSFAYVMDENLSLQVPIRTPMKKQSSSKSKKPGHRAAMSECGCDSRRDFNGFEAFRVLDTDATTGNDRNDSNSESICRSKRESFSVSKIWLRGKKDEVSGRKMESSRRAFSFRFPLQRNVGGADEAKQAHDERGGRRAMSEIDVNRWEDGGISDLGFGDEVPHSCNSLDSQPNAPSFARRTLLWLMGRPNKVSSFSSNV